MKADLTIYQHIHPEISEQFSYKPELALIVTKIIVAGWDKEGEFCECIEELHRKMNPFLASIFRFETFEEEHREELEDIRYFDSYLESVMKKCQEDMYPYEVQINEYQKALDQFMKDKYVLISDEDLCNTVGLELHILKDLIQELVQKKFISVKQTNEGMLYKILNLPKCLEDYDYFFRYYRPDPEKPKPEKPKPVLSDKIEEVDFVDADALFSHIPD